MRERVLADPIDWLLEDDHLRVAPSRGVVQRVQLRVEEWSHLPNVTAVCQPCSPNLSKYWRFLKRVKGQRCLDKLMRYLITEPLTIHQGIAVVIFLLTSLCRSFATTPSCHVLKVIDVQLQSARRFEYRNYSDMVVESFSSWCTDLKAYSRWQYIMGRDKLDFIWFQMIVQMPFSI